MNCKGASNALTPVITETRRRVDAGYRERPAGTPIARITTRTVCTMIMARRSASRSAATAETCDNAPGTEANNAV